MSKQNRFDRILNIALAVAVVVFLVEYFFIRETPGNFDTATTAGSAFAPVQLGTKEATADSGAISNAAAGSLSLEELPPFSPLRWDHLETQVARDIPTLVLVFTSWCPYCNKLMPEIIGLANEQQGKLNVLAISIDEDRNAIRSYISSLPVLPPFAIYHNATDNERAVVQAFLHNKELNFTGGIPYIAVFRDGKALQQIGGYVEKSVLTQMLGRIEQQKNSGNNGAS